jgi:hypothetical protein
VRFDDEDSTQNKEHSKMNFIYFIRVHDQSYLQNWRTTDFHRLIFHGLGTYESVTDDGDTHARQAAKKNREVYHVWRSGTYVPPVFSPRAWELVVCPDASRKLADLPGVEFQEVIGEHLVDLKMPPLGVMPQPPYHDESPSDLFDHIQGKAFLGERPHHPEFAPNVAGYQQMFPGVLIEVEDELDDINKVSVNWGSGYHYSENVRLSMKMLERHAIYGAGGCAFVLTEEAFKRLVPFLDRDYYEFAVMDLRPDPPSIFTPEQYEKARKYNQRKNSKNVPGDT